MWLIIAIPIGLFILWKYGQWEDKKQMEKLIQEEKRVERERAHANSLVGLSLRQTELKQELENVETGLGLLAEEAKKKKEALNKKDAS